MMQGLTSSVWLSRMAMSLVMSPCRNGFDSAPETRTAALFIKCSLTKQVLATVEDEKNLALTFWAELKHRLV